MLTIDEIRKILKLLSLEAIVSPSEDFKFYIMRETQGYRDGDIGKLQAKLSIMLQVAEQTRNTIP